MNSIVRSAVIAIVVLAALSIITRNSINVSAQSTSTAPARHYYLSKGTVNGNAAKTACASGYHFASFAELNDTSNITYNRTLGRTFADSGQGPPQLLGSTMLGIGWIRTGAASNATVSNGDNSTPTNCNNWSTANSGDVGEVAFFALYTFASTGSPPALNFRNNFACDNSQGDGIGVWCVQN